MNKLIEWLKQVRTELDNVLTQRRLDKQWEKYQDELVAVDYPVVNRVKQKESAARRTARMYTELLGIVENVKEDKLYIKRKNMVTYEKIVGMYL